MALIDHDGLDFVDTAYAAKRGWTFGGDSTQVAVVTAGAGRDGGSAIVLNKNQNTWNAPFATKSLPTGYAAFTFILAVYVTALPTANAIRLQFLEGSTVHLEFQIGTTGAVALYKGPGTTLLQDSIFSVTTGTWQVWMFSATINDSTGSWSLSIDGVATGSGSSVDTRNGGTGVVNAITAISSSPNSTSNFKIDDLGMFDAVVTHADYRNEAIMPTADGSHADWSLSTGADGYALVDEIPASLSDFLSTASVGNKVSFSYDAPTVTGDIDALTWRPLLRAAVAGVRSVRAFIRSGGVDYPHGTTHTVGSDDAYYAWTWAVHPDTTVAFDSGDFPLEVGLEVTA